MSEIEELKPEIEIVFNYSNNLTIDEIANILERDNFKVGAAVGRLELDGVIISSGEKTVYRPDGTGILIGTYSKRVDNNA